MDHYWKDKLPGILMTSQFLFKLMHDSRCFYYALDEPKQEYVKDEDNYNVLLCLSVTSSSCLVLMLQKNFGSSGKISIYLLLIYVEMMLVLFVVKLKMHYKFSTLFLAW